VSPPQPLVMQMPSPPSLLEQVVSGSGQPALQGTHTPSPLPSGADPGYRPGAAAVGIARAILKLFERHRLAAIAGVAAGGPTGASGPPVLVEPPVEAEEGSQIPSRELVLRGTMQSMPGPQGPTPSGRTS